jgi:hypothetical protein
MKSIYIYIEGFINAVLQALIKEMKQHVPIDFGAAQRFVAVRILPSPPSNQR